MQQQEVKLRYPMFKQGFYWLSSWQGVIYCINPPTHGIFLIKKHTAKVLISHATTWPNLHTQSRFWRRQKCNFSSLWWSKPLTYIWKKPRQLKTAIAAEPKVALKFQKHCKIITSNSIIYFCKHCHQNTFKRTVTVYTKWWHYMAKWYCQWGYILYEGKIKPYVLTESELS